MGVLLPLGWGCGGQEVPDRVPDGPRVAWVITDNFCSHVSTQKCLQIGQDYECPLALQMGLWRTGGS